MKKITELKNKEINAVSGGMGLIDWAYDHKAEIAVASAVILTSITVGIPTLYYLGYICAEETLEQILAKGNLILETPDMF